MKLFQVLIKVAKVLQLALIKLVLLGKQINLTSDNTTITSNNFKVDKNGNMICANANMNNTTITNGSIVLKANGNHVIQVQKKNDNTERVYMNEHYIVIQLSGYRDIVSIGNINGNEGCIFLSGNGYTELLSSGIKTPTLTQTSLANQKKNFEKMQDNALKILNQIDIYKYNLKCEKDTDKKHIGFVIGDEYNYSKEVTSIENDGVDNYSYTSLCVKAIQEQQKEIETLKNEIKKLKKEK